jgi:hypothetical protein
MNKTKDAPQQRTYKGAKVMAASSGKNMNAITTEQSGRDNRGIQDRDFLAS